RGFHVTGVQTCALPIFAQQGPMAEDVRPCSAKSRYEALSTRGLALSSVWRGVPIRGRVGDSRQATRRASRVHLGLGPSVARTLEIGRASCRERADGGA